MASECRFRRTSTWVHFRNNFCEQIFQTSMQVSINDSKTVEFPGTRDRNVAYPNISLSLNCVWNREAWQAECEWHSFLNTCVIISFVGRLLPIFARHSAFNGDGNRTELEILEYLNTRVGTGNRDRARRGASWHVLANHKSWKSQNRTEPWGSFSLLRKRQRGKQIYVELRCCSGARYCLHLIWDNLQGSSIGFGVISCSMFCLVLLTEIH